MPEVVNCRVCEHPHLLDQPCGICCDKAWRQGYEEGINDLHGRLLVFLNRGRVITESLLMQVVYILREEG